MWNTFQLAEKCERDLEVASNRLPEFVTEFGGIVVTNKILSQDDILRNNPTT